MERLLQGRCSAQPESQQYLCTLQRSCKATEGADFFHLSIHGLHTASLSACEASQWPRREYMQDSRPLRGQGGSQADLTEEDDTGTKKVRSAP